MALLTMSSHSAVDRATTQPRFQALSPFPPLSSTGPGNEVVHVRDSELKSKTQGHVRLSSRDYALAT